VPVAVAADELPLAAELGTSRCCPARCALRPTALIEDTAAELSPGRSAGPTRWACAACRSPRAAADAAA
jgi:hypothetical protein